MTPLSDIREKGIQQEVGDPVDEPPGPAHPLVPKRPCGCMLRRVVQGMQLWPEHEPGVLKSPHKRAQPPPTRPGFDMAHPHVGKAMELENK